MVIAVFPVAYKQVSPRQFGWRKAEEVDRLEAVAVGAIRGKRFIGKPAPHQSVRIRDVVFSSPKRSAFVVVLVKANVIPTYPHAIRPGLDDVNGTVSLLASILVEQLGGEIRFEELITKSNAA